MGVGKLLIVGLVLVGFIAGLMAYQFVSGGMASIFTGLATTTALNSIDSVRFSSSSQGFSNSNHNSIPTKMSLRGRVTDFNGVLVDDANLGVKISDANSCSQNVFFDYNYP
ncbi:MAG: hypothetical protein HY393_01925, partial [Candidatus Diapherotrites archaeon]|nr:hypothetical protein [Candidatus Diapherotrites archaeon]